MKIAIKISLLLVLAGYSLLSDGQTFELSKTGTILSIKGTSSLHDWKMDLKEFNSGFRLRQEGSLIKGFENVTFTCKAKDIKSESSLMDNKAYNALKAEDFPEINFSGISTTAFVTEDKKFTGNLNGRLNVAGETRDVTIPFDGTFVDSNAINISVAYDLYMSSFNVNPPTFLFGALKTDDKISVSFSMQFVQKAQ